MRGGLAAYLGRAPSKIIAVYFLFLFGLVAPGAMSLAPLVRGVGSSLIWLPGAKLDAPWVGAGVVLCMMWPGLELETPRLGPPPLPPAWAICAAMVTATSAAAYIAIFFKVMRTPPVAFERFAGAQMPPSARSMTATHLRAELS